MVTRKMTKEEYLAEIFTYSFDDGDTVSQKNYIIEYKNSTLSTLSYYDLRTGEAVFY